MTPTSRAAKGQGGAKKATSRSRRASAANKATGRTSGGVRRQQGSRVERPFPRRPLEDAIRIVLALKDHFGGNPRPPVDIAKALSYRTSNNNNFFYQAAASRDFGFTTGGRDSAEIALDDRGRRYAYAESEEVEKAVLREAFLSIKVFREVFEYYKGPDLPEKKFLSNVLEGQFDISPEVHDEFIDLYRRNTDYAGLKASDAPAGVLTAGDSPIAGTRPDVVTVDEPEGDSSGRVSCFVIMPFTEKTEDYREGFFEEVLKSIIGPAGKKAGFSVSTARRDGSDVIQSTIVNRLLDDDLVIADLTEHNPNVLFELGMRMAFDKPVVLIKAKGTGRIFDVDNMLRVFEYNPALWPSTVEADVPNLAQFIHAAWSNRLTDNSYLRLLRRAAADSLPES